MDISEIHINSDILNSMNPTLDWLQNCILLANQHFKTPYKDKASFIIIQGKKVNRPNHGILHASRIMLYTIRIIHGLAQQSCAEISYSGLQNSEGRNLVRWVISKLIVDSKFIHKMALTAIFQRSGRQSEISSSENPNLYNSYEQEDY